MNEAIDRMGFCQLRRSRIFTSAIRNFRIIKGEEKKTKEVGQRNVKRSSRSAVAGRLFNRSFTRSAKLSLKQATSVQEIESRGV